MAIASNVARVFVFVVICLVPLTTAERDAERIMTDFAGQANINDFQAAGRDLKSGVLLSSLRDGKVDAFRSSTGAATQGLDAIRRLDPQSAVDGLLPHKKEALGEVKYETANRLISRVLNLLHIPAGEDPLQQALDAGIMATAASTVIASDLSQVTSSNLDRILAGHKHLKDAYTKSQAETYKAILRNMLFLKEGLGAYSGEADYIEDDYCDPAEFTPPSRKHAEYRGPGLKLTIKMGECALDYRKAFFDWKFNIFCNKPTLIYTKTPPMYISEHTTPAVFKTRECKHTKLEYDEVEAVLHTFDGSSFLNPGAINNILFSNVFPTNTRLRSGSFNAFSGRNSTAGDLLGSLLDWDLGAFDMRNKKPWDLLSFGSEKRLLGARDDLTGRFTSRRPLVPEFLKKGAASLLE